MEPSESLCVGSASSGTGGVQKSLPFKSTLGRLLPDPGNRGQTPEAKVGLPCRIVPSNPR